MRAVAPIDLAPSPTTSPRLGETGDGPAALCLGFAAEPVVDLAHDDAPLLYSECLARMRVAENVLLTPGDFLGDLEARGGIALLDAAMVELVMGALADDPHVRLGCNVSPRTLADADGWSRLMQRIGERAWLASRLTLEITESFPLDEIHGAAGRLAEAKRLGCRLAIDDFGAGFATTAHLYGVDVEWDIVKIDRSCFGDLRKTPTGREGLRTLVQLAKCLAPVVVVEGIETPEHLALARVSGARFGQGWMFDRPARQRWCVPADETGQRLAGAMMAHGAVLRPSAASPAESTVPGDASTDTERHSLLFRVDRIGERMRALVSRARTGGAD